MALRLNLQSWTTQRLIGRATILIVAVILLQVMASILFYEEIDRQTVREDHARRIAELLVVSHRLDARAISDTDAIMSTRHLQVAIARTPRITASGTVPMVAFVREKILQWEPELAQHQLLLDRERTRGGREHLVGALQMEDGRWINFRSMDISSGWKIALRATVMTLAFTGLSIFALIYLLRLMGEPLRLLTEATRQVGAGRNVQLEEKGPADLRNLSHAFNQMQDRIQTLVTDQAKALEAMSHDLRTPLSRLKLVSSYVGDEDVRIIADDSINEMEAMLSSLSAFLYVQHLESSPEPYDLVMEVQSILSRYPQVQMAKHPTELMVTGYKAPFLLALEPLLENAVQYGDTATLDILQDKQGWQIHLQDHGPGIAECFMQQILDPFFRIDDARARNTAGFGLGIPTAYRALMRFGGALHFENAAGGGLRVIIGVPLTAW